MISDSEFYTRRIVEERAAAATAINAAIGKRHSELAELHAEKLTLLLEGEPRPSPTH